MSKETTRTVKILLIAYIIVIVLNLCSNFRYYSSGHPWAPSMFFSLAVTTLGVLGGSLLARLFFRTCNWSDKPTLKILRAVFILAIYGVVLMMVVMQSMQFFFHYGYPSTQEYIEDCSYSALLSMIIGLMICGQQFLVQLKKSIEDNEHIKQEMIQSRYETLKSQVNPHFLFNSLNTLTVMIPNQPDVAVSFVEQLSKVFRYSLQHSDEHTIALATELKVVKSYLFLNEQRYNSKLTADIKIDAAAENKKILTQALLMLVENAIKHNEISHENPLTVSIYDEGDFLVVKNTLQRKTLIEPSTNVGLENIRKRYALATDTPVEVYENNGFFTVKIPLLP